MGKARTWQVLFCTFVKKLFGGFLRFRVKPADSPLNPPCFSVIPRPISPPNIAAEQTHVQHPSQRGQESRFEHRRDPMTDTALPAEIRQFSAKKQDPASAHHPHPGGQSRPTLYTCKRITPKKHGIFAGSQSARTSHLLLSARFLRHPPYPLSGENKPGVQPPGLNFALSMEGQNMD